MYSGEKDTITIHCYKCGKPHQVPTALENCCGLEDYLCKECSRKQIFNYDEMEELDYFALNSYLAIPRGGA